MLLASILWAVVFSNTPMAGAISQQAADCALQVGEPAFCDGKTCWLTRDKSVATCKVSPVSGDAASMQGQ